MSDTDATQPLKKPSRTPPSERLVVEGGHTLHGELPVGGSKNTVLMMMSAAILAPGATTIQNVSVLHDVWTLADAMRSVGCTVEYAPDDDPTTPETLTIDASEISSSHPPRRLITALRASFYMFGALLGRTGEARVALPGGDAFGERPVNLHLEGLRAFGAEIDVEDGAAVARAPADGLSGGTFHLDPSSVGATVNLLLGAVTANGSSKITNAAQEPDVVMFGEMLKAMGARIEGLGTDTIEVEGVDVLSPVTFRNASDRIESGTYVIAAALAGEPGSTLRVTNANPQHLGDNFFDPCREAGIEIETGDTWIDVKVPERLHSVSIETAPYPGFPTDLQAQWTVLMTRADGEAHITDTIYPERFQHVPELGKMGADIHIEDNTAVVHEGSLEGAEVQSEDVRAGVALVLAGLIASGETIVSGLHHLDRGYERLEEKLREAGAKVHRLSADEEA